MEATDLSEGEKQVVVTQDLISLHDATTETSNRVIEDPEKGSHTFVAWYEEFGNLPGDWKCCKTCGHHDVTRLFIWFLIAVGATILRLFSELLKRMGG